MVKNTALKTNKIRTNGMPKTWKNINWLKKSEIGWKDLSILSSIPSAFMNLGSKIMNLF